MKLNPSPKTSSSRSRSANHSQRLAPRCELVDRLSPGSPRSSRRILLVDKKPNLPGSLTDLLVAQGYFVIPAADGQEVLEFADLLPVDLALLDLNMPAQNGWNIFRWLTTKHPRIPTIVATTCSNQFFASLHARAGALIQKPMNIPTLIQTMEKLMAEPTARHANNRLPGNQRGGINQV